MKYKNLIGSNKTLLLNWILWANCQCRNCLDIINSFRWIIFPSACLPVDDPGLKVSLVPVNDELLAGVNDLHEGEMGLALLLHRFVHCLHQIIFHNIIVRLFKEKLISDQVYFVGNVGWIEPVTPNRFSYAPKRERDQNMVLNLLRYHHRDK